jgi:hypothetical protein
MVYGRSEDGDWDVQLGGVYTYEGAQDWLSERTDVALWFSLVADVLTIEGGLSQGAAAVYFHGLAIGAECGDAPFGDLSIRDVFGRWYKIRFDANCDGCGLVSFEGVNLGRVCLPVEEHATALRHLFQEPA